VELDVDLELGRRGRRVRVRDRRPEVRVRRPGLHDRDRNGRRGPGGGRLRGDLDRVGQRNIGSVELVVLGLERLRQPNIRCRSGGAEQTDRAGRCRGERETGDAEQSAAIAIALITLGSMTVNVLLPFIYMIIAAGVTYLLGQWMEVFPRNVFARSTGIVLLGFVIALCCVYNFRRYFVAWPTSPTTRTIFSRELS